MSNKLMTTEAVLEWAANSGPVESLLGKPVRDADTETAARIATAMRVLAALEKEDAWLCQEMEAGGNPFDGERHNEMWVMLRRAAAEEGE